MAAPADRVQLIKQESTAKGGDDADSTEFLNDQPLDPHEDAPEVQGVYFQPPAPSVLKDEDVFISRDAAGNMCFRDKVDATLRTLSDLLSGAGGGISEAQHELLDTLTHMIVETSYEEYEYTGNRVDAIRVYTDSGKATKIRETEFTYTANQVTTIVTKQYDGVPAVQDTVTETLNYTGNKLDDIDRVKT